jgi:peptidoglycan L-alanyl-D-glutamate endopeptidase CwlK
MYQLSEKSINKLAGVHPDLVKVIKRAIEITPVDFTVIEGLRTKERQAYLVKKGASKTMRSRHLTGHAVDIAPIVNGKISWVMKDYKPIVDAVKQAALELKISMEHGYDWGWDGPHHELLRSIYK